RPDPDAPGRARRADRGRPAVRSGRDGEERRAAGDGRVSPARRRDRFRAPGDGRADQAAMPGTLGCSRRPTRDGSVLHRRRPVVAPRSRRMSARRGSSGRTLWLLLATLLLVGVALLLARGISPGTAASPAASPSSDGLHMEVPERAPERIAAPHSEPRTTRTSPQVEPEADPVAI